MMSLTLCKTDLISLFVVRHYPTQGYKQKKLTTLKTCLCGSPDYFQQYGRPKTPKDLQHHNWVIYKLTKRTVVLKKDTREFIIKVNGTISTNNSAARTAFIEGGHGIGRIPTYDALSKIKSGSLETVLNDYTLDDIDMYGVFPPGAANSKKLRLLLDYLEEYFLNAGRI